MIQSSIPEGLELIPTRDGAIIRKACYNRKNIFFGFWILLIDAMTALAYSNLISKSDHTLLRFPPVMVINAMGLLCGNYLAAASICNKTDVIVSAESVRVNRGPLLCPGNKVVKNSDIRNVMVREQRKSRGASFYRVMYVDSSNHEQILLNLIKRNEEAEFIAQTIREALKV